MKYIKIITLVASIFLIISCGGGGGDTQGTVPQAMEIDKTYNTQEGQIITKNSEEESILLLETTIASGATTATLERGSAEIK